MERLQGSPSVLGWNDSKGVILSWDGMTPGESFYPSGALRTGMQLQAFLLCVYTPLFTLWAAYVNELLPLPVCSHTKAYVRAWEENPVT